MKPRGLSLIEPMVALSIFAVSAVLSCFPTVMRMGKDNTMSSQALYFAQESMDTVLRKQNNPGAPAPHSPTALQGQHLSQPVAWQSMTRTVTSSPSSMDPVNLVDITVTIDKQPGTISVLSSSDLQTQTTFTTTGGIGDAALGPDGRVLCVSLPRLRTVVALDAMRGTRQSSFGVPGGPEVVAMPRLGELWVGCQDRFVRVVSLDRGHHLLATPLHLQADGARLRQVVSNLISNAFHHCFDGGVVEISLDRVDGQIRFSIRDHGPGIAADRLATLFDLPTGQVTLRGLGLWLCKRVVEAHGGGITCYGEAGYGCCFRVTLPAGEET